MSYFSRTWWKKSKTPNLTRIGSRWLEIWLHKYLISPIEIGVNRPVHNCLESGQFTMISMGLIRYSCGHILGPHELIPTKFGLYMLFIMLHWYMVFKNSEMQKQDICDIITSVLYSNAQSYVVTFCRVTWTLILKCVCFFLK